jgi:hypothetical protein
VAICEKEALGKGETQLVNLLGQLGPVENATCHVSTEDEVEGGVVHPLALDVVDFEFDVGRNPKDSVHV